MFANRMCYEAVFSMFYKTVAGKREGVRTGQNLSFVQLWNVLRLTPGPHHHPIAFLLNTSLVIFLV